MDVSDIREQVRKQRRKVDFDTYDITVDELIRRVGRGRIEIAPSYQRQFRWDVKRQSSLIESLLLGIPIPNLFMATNSNDDNGMQWEIVDGLQRTLSLVSFAGNAEQRGEAKIFDTPLKLENLQKLTYCNGLTFDELPLDMQDLLLDRPVKITVLNDKSDKQVRFDLFERLNTGGISLTDQEVRECVFRGPFIDLLQKLSSNNNFRLVFRVPKSREKDGTLQEAVLRFFAYLEKYQSFDHSVKDFLNQYTIDVTERPEDLKEKEEIFNTTFKFLAQCFPDGLRRSRSTTPINFYEGISVGAALALHIKPDLKPRNSYKWIDDPDFINSIVGATNSAPKVRMRIEYSRNGFLQS